MSSIVIDTVHYIIPENLEKNMPVNPQKNFPFETKNMRIKILK